MKKLSIYLMSAFLGLFAANVHAQVSSCNATAPELNSATHGSDIALDGTTPAPTLNITASSELPNVEYLITLNGTTAVGDTANGDVVLGADADGVFTPQDITRYGITVASGNTLDIVAIGYDLNQVKTVADALLNNEVTPGNPCCNIFGLIPDAAGFCDSVNAAGITSAADINNLEDVLVIFDALDPNQLSAESLLSSIGLVNTYANIIPPNCGQSALPICYGANLNQRYSYPVGDAVSVRKLEGINSLAVLPNPATEGSFTVSLNMDNATDLTINVYNTLGTVVATQSLGMIEGQINQTISTANMAAGVYFVELTDGAAKQTTKLIIQK